MKIRHWLNKTELKEIAENWEVLNKEEFSKQKAFYEIDFEEEKAKLCLENEIYGDDFKGTLRYIEGKNKHIEFDLN